MRTIVGLGNPGNSYRNTRHNAGFLAVDAFLEYAASLSAHQQSGRGKRAANTQFGRSRGPYQWFRGDIFGTEYCLVKPTTFMNESGRAITSLRTRGVFTHLDELLVVVDEVNLDLGRIRLRPKGSAGGHNGLKSIISALGSGEFARLRLGVGPRPAGDEMYDYVLGSFRPEEREKLSPVIQSSCEVIEQWIDSGMDAALRAAAEADSDT